MRNTKIWTDLDRGTLENARGKNNNNKKQQAAVSVKTEKQKYWLNIRFLALATAAGVVVS